MHSCSVRPGRPPVPVESTILNLHFSVFTSRFRRFSVTDFFSGQRQKHIFKRRLLCAKITKRKSVCAECVDYFANQAVAASLHNHPVAISIDSSDSRQSLKL